MFFTPHLRNYFRQIICTRDPAFLYELQFPVIKGRISTRIIIASATIINKAIFLTYLSIPFYHRFKSHKTANDVF